MEQSPLILVVDDSHLNVSMLRRVLERANMRVMTANDGQECIEKVKTVLPDLILLDVMMPRLNGFETCQILRSQPETSHIPVIFVTARAERSDRISALDLGAIDYLTKPIDIEETLARVRTQLRLQALNRRNLELSLRLTEARQAAAMGAFARGVAHNLNNLLSVAMGYQELLALPNLENTQRSRAASSVQSSLERIRRLVNQIDFMGSDLIIKRSPVGVSELLHDALERFQIDHNLALPGLIRKVDVSETFTVATNREAMEEVMTHLMMNAWESYPPATPPEERRILLAASVEGDSPRHLSIRVRDWGRGLDPSVTDNLFDPFVTTKSTLGSGLGLTLARHTLSQLEAELQLISNADPTGVTAVILYPL